MKSLNQTHLKLILALALTLGFGLTLLFPGGARAQTEEKQQRYDMAVGPYQLSVRLGTDALKTGNDIPLQILFENGSPPNASSKNMNLQIQTVPGARVSATPVKLSVEPTGDGKGWQGKVNYPVSGTWAITLTIADGKNTWTATTPYFNVAPPPAIPNWLAWFLGLFPAIVFLIVLTYFGYRYYRRFRQETK